MSLGDALYAELSAGGYTYDDDEELALGDALDELGRGQSVAQLARELGVPRSTLRGWYAGAKPKRDVGGILSVARTMRRAADLQGREDELRDNIMGVSITGWLVVSSDPPRRATVPANRLDLDPDIADDIIEAYLSGAGPGRLAALFTRGVGDKFYRNALRNNAFDVLSVDGWA